MIVYLDTSAVLRHLLGQPGRLQDFGKWQAAYTSELMGVEARRVFDRMRLAGHLDDANLARAHRELARVEQAVGGILLTRAVLHRAALPMPTAVKTLDAIHLASAMLFREHREESLLFATHDTNQARAAWALGFEVQGTEDGKAERS